MEGWVCGVRQGARLMAQQTPQLFGNMRCIWMQYNAHILQDCPFVALQLSQLVHTDHKSGYRRVERKTLDIVFDLFDDLMRSEEHTSELQSRENLVCRLLLEKKKKNTEINK